MKKLIFLPLLVVIGFSMMSCNDDFLAGNKRDLYMYSDTLFLNINQGNVSVSIPIPGVSDKDYTIYMQPRWLSFSSMHGQITNGSVILTFSIDKSNVYFSNNTQYSSVILDVEDEGLYSFVVGLTNPG